MSYEDKEDKPRHTWGTAPDYYTNAIICVLCGQEAAWDGWDFSCYEDCPPTLFDPSDHDVRCEDYMGNRCPGVHDGKNSRTMIWHRRYVVEVTTHRGKTVSRGSLVREICNVPFCDEVIIESPYAARKRGR